MPDTRKHKILYIEDDEVTAELCRVVLDDLGYDVELAFTGRAGLDLFEKDIFDVVLLDYQLPDSNGIDVATEILARAPLTPIIFMTGRGSEKVAAQAVATGVAFYIIKDNQDIYTTILPELITKAITRMQDKRDTLEINEQLRISEEKYRSIFEGTAEGVITIDAEGLIESVNPQAETIFGYTASEILGQNVSILMAEEDRAEHDVYTRESQLHASRIINFSRDLEGLHKDGSLFPIELSVSPMTVGGNKKFIGIVRDITERKLAGDALSDKLSFIEKIVSESPFGIATYGEDGFCTSVNQAALEIIGATEEQALDQNFNKTESWKTSGLFDAAQEALSSGEVQNLTVNLTTTFDRETHVECYLIPFVEQGESHLLLIFHDISERVSAEKAAIKAMQKAEQANHAKSDFLSSMSHELRTPMNAILGFGQLLENNPKEKLSAKQLDHTRQILKGGEHLLTLIDQVLELSKIESGNISLSLENVLACDVIDESLKMVQAQAAERKIELKVLSSIEKQTMLWTDHIRFRQILLNLLSNAIKYNHPEGEVSVTLENVSGNYLKISVADKGYGIPEQKQDGIFEPFNRLGRESGEIEGTGIGLTITKQIIALLEGEIGFESEEGIGSTFWIKLPLTEHEDAPVENSQNEDGNDAEKNVDEIAGVVLYIEDNPANLRLMEAVIGRLPEVVMISAHTAELGLEMAKNALPNIILMDINLPGMDGIAALGELRKIDETKNIPVIAISAAAMPKEIERGKMAGFDDYITKPIIVPEVLASISTYIK